MTVSVGCLEVGPDVHFINLDGRNISCIPLEKGLFLTMRCFYYVQSVTHRCIFTLDCQAQFVVLPFGLLIGRARRRSRHSVFDIRGTCWCAKLSPLIICPLHFFLHTFCIKINKIKCFCILKKVHVFSFFFLTNELCFICSLWNTKKKKKIKRETKSTKKCK